MLANGVLMVTVSLSDVRQCLRDRYVGFVRRHAKFIIILWIAVIAGFGSQSPSLFSDTATLQNIISAPHGSSSYDAEQVFRGLFPLLADRLPLFIYVVAAAGGVSPTYRITADPVAKTFVMRLLDILGTDPCCSNITTRGFSNFSSYAGPFAARRGLLVRVDAPVGDAYQRELAQHLGSITQSLSDAMALSSASPALTAGVVGSSLWINDGETVGLGGKHIALSVALVAPVVLSLSFYILRSPRLLLLPLLAAATATTIVFGVLHCAALSGASIAPSVPMLVFALSVALASIYALLFLFRYRKVMRYSRSVEAIALAVDALGPPILASCAVVATLTLPLSMFGVGLLNGVGFGCVVAALISMSVTLSLLPAVLMAGHTFFSSAADKVRFCGYQGTGIENAVLEGNDFDEQDLLREPPSFYESPEYSEHVQRSLFRHLRVIISSRVRAAAVVVLSLALAAILAWRALTISLSVELDGYNAAKDNDLNWQPFDAVFSRGLLLPYTLTFTAHTPSCDFTALWAAAAAAVRTVTLFDNATYTLHSFDGPVAHNGQLHPQPTPSAITRWSRYIRSSNSTETPSGIVMYLYPPFDPLAGGSASATHYSQLQAAVASASEYVADCGAMHVHIGGIAPAVLDQMHVAQLNFPTAFAISLTAALLFVGLCLWSPVAPIRCVFGAAFSVAMALGVGSAVYGPPRLLGGLPEMCWIAPYVVTLLASAASLGYHILFSFVSGDIHSGADAVLLRRDPEQCILYALCVSGKTVTAAGLIMFVTYAAMGTFSSTWLSGEIGLMLTIGALSDVFIVRIFVMPSFMALLGQYNWSRSVHGNVLRRPGSKRQQVDSAGRGELASSPRGDDVSTRDHFSGRLEDTQSSSERFPISAARYGSV